MATILDLLMALNRDELPPVPAPAQPVPLAPAPTGNVPEFGGPSQVTEPPQAPLDTRIIQQILAQRGPAPTPPPPTTTLGGIANALMGFSAGVQGRGPEFAAQLQQPQREYQRQLNAYNNLGTELGTRGLEAAQRQQELKTRRAQEVSDRQLEQEFQRESKRLGLTDQREMEMFRDTLLARRQREDDERAAAEQRRREKAQQERDARVFEYDLVKKDKAPSDVAQDISQYMAGIKPALSPATRRWQEQQAKKLQLEQDRLQAQISRLNRIGTGGGGAGKPMAVLDDGSTVPISKVDTKNGRAIIDGKPRKVVGYTGGGASSQPQAAVPQGQKADPLGIR